MSEFRGGDSRYQSTEPLPHLNQPVIYKEQRRLRPYPVQERSKINRRGFIKWVGAATAGTVLAAQMDKSDVITSSGFFSKNEKPVVQNEQKELKSDTGKIQELSSEPQTLLQVAETQVAQEQESNEHSLQEKLNAVLSVRMFDEYGGIREERILAENEFAQNAQTLEDIDSGLSVCFNHDAVLTLLTKRSMLRNEGHPDLPQLEPHDQDFVHLYDIQAPERFAMCVDAINQLKPKLEQLLPKILEARSDKDSLSQLPIDQILESIIVNPAFLYQTLMEECSGFTYRGEAPAIEQYRGEYAGSEEVLKKYVGIINEATGLQYEANDIPGSMAGDGDASGGAIGMQFMPNNAVEFTQYMQEIGEKGNIFHPMDGLKMAVLFFAFRNFRNGDFETMKEGFMAWNPKDSEAERVAIRGESYQEYMSRPTRLSINTP